MKKNKKIFILITIFILVIVIISLIYIGTNKKINNLDKGTIANLKPISSKFPEFTIILDKQGESNGMDLTEITLKDKAIQNYEFEAGIYNGWETKTDRYRGSRLKDIIEKIEVGEYTGLTFYTNNKQSVTYKKEDITENVFLIYKRNGKDIRQNEKNAITLLRVDKDYNYSLENIFGIIFLNEKNEVIDENNENSKDDEDKKNEQ